MLRVVLIVGCFALLLQPQAPPLRIVVLEGEAAVNIIQQNTAVRPLVEVRDRNNVPVAGATVTFTIGGGQPAAFAGGVQTLTVTTNAAGQAAAGGFNVLGPGAIQVQVQAAYQGQIATAAISQTNFATAAAASQAGAASGGSSSGAAGGGSGGGGGISGTTIGIVGGAVAAGAVAATQVVGGGDEGVSYSGSISGQLAVTVTNTSSSFVTTCITTYAVTGTITMTLVNDNASGAAVVDGARNHVTIAAGGQCAAPPVTTLPFHFEASVSGGPSSLAFRATNNFTAPAPDGGTATSSETISFSGAASGATITGTVALEARSTSTGSVTAQGVPYTSAIGGTSAFPVTMTGTP